MAKNIGILGTGMVAQTIAAKLIELGYQVTIGTRDVANTMAQTGRNAYGGPSFSDWHKQHAKVKLSGFDAAARAGDVIFFCVKGDAALASLKHLRPESVQGKTIIDITNPLDLSKGMPPSLLPQYTNTNSLAEEIQRALPDGHVVKALNMVNCEVMVNPKKSGGDPTMFIAGNNPQAKEEVKKFLKQFGWSDIIDLGDISGARGMEMLLPAWLRVWGATQNGYFGFKIVR
jgi:8-hydroxy-5-deazaflavin:NADPH oxidoreductase